MTLKMTEIKDELFLNNNYLINNNNNDMNNETNIEERFECDCKLGPNDNPCYEQFNIKDMIDHRIDYQSCDYWDDDCYNLLNERIIAIMYSVIHFLLNTFSIKIIKTKKLFQNLKNG
jgi:hypothetical protein